MHYKRFHTKHSLTTNPLIQTMSSNRIPDDPSCRLKRNWDRDILVWNNNYGKKHRNFTRFRTVFNNIVQNKFLITAWSMEHDTKWPLIIINRTWLIVNCHTEVVNKIWSRTVNETFYWIIFKTKSTPKKIIFYNSPIYRKISGKRNEMFSPI